MLQFFASQEHTQALNEVALQEILDCCLFEPGPWHPPKGRVEPLQIPAVNREHLTTPAGLLLNELQRSPFNLVRCVDTMLENVRSGLVLCFCCGGRLACAVCLLYTSPSPRDRG